MKQKNKKQWIKKRHVIVTKLLKPTLGAYCRRKYSIDIEPFKEQGDRPYLIVMNHQTGFDQFFVSLTFNRPVYYIASEDIFSMGWVSKLISWLVAPIPIKKQTTDLNAVRTCIRVAKEGGTIALAPEGNRTFDGRQVYIKPAIISLMKKLKLPMAFFRIEGGYGIQPRWSDVVRKGRMRSYVSRVLEPEEYKNMSDEELYELICRELDVNEANAEHSYSHKKAAEYLERAVYVCPECGLSTFESSNDIIECKKCGMKIKYLLTTELEGVGFEFPFRFVAEWYDYQNDFINGLDVTKMCDEPIYRDVAEFSEVAVYEKKHLIDSSADIVLYGDRIEIGDKFTFRFDETDVVTVLGKNKINIYHGSKVYQIKPDKRFNALKYVNIFNRYKNISEAREDDKFLGL